MRQVHLPLLCERHSAPMMDSHVFVCIAEGAFNGKSPVVHIFDLFKLIFPEGLAGQTAVQKGGTSASAI